MDTKRKRHIILILIIILLIVFIIYKEFGREKPPEKAIERKPLTYPMIAIVMDDIGSNKQIAEHILNISAPITLSILPYEPYTKWIAEEGYRRGYEIIAHIPMEPKEPHQLGNGGLYTWMSDDEIRETINSSINSIPHIIGISNHMGSAFTEDERAMNIVFSEIKGRGLFFLDSLTTAGSVGARLAKTHSIKVVKRDVFLDDKDDPIAIRVEFERLVKIAKKKGYAIALAHPRENTIRFLKEAATDKRVRIVPISQILLVLKK